MKRFGQGVLILILAACSKVEPQIQGDLRLTAASIVDVQAGTVSLPQDVLIRDGLIILIAATGGDLLNAATTNTIDATGLYLLPGLIDVHAHIGHGGLVPVTQSDREESLQQFVRYGVTSIFVPGGGGGNDEQLIEWKQRCKSNELVCPRVFGSGDIVTAFGSHPITTIWGLPADVDPAITHARGAVSLKDDESAAPIIDRKSAMHVDAIKIVVEDGPGAFAPKPRLKRAKIAEIVAAAHARDLKVFAHASLAEHVDDVIAAGADGIMHSTDDRISDQTLLAMAERGAFYVATLSLFDAFVDRAFQRRIQEPYAVAGVSGKALQSFDNEQYWSGGIDTPEETVAYIGAIQDNIRRADEFGVPIALGTDTNNPQVFPGYSAHEELALMVEAGLTSKAALRAATIGGASFLDLDDQIGQIKVGFRADMIVLRLNPLESIIHSRTIEHVISDGMLVNNIVSDKQL